MTVKISPSLLSSDFSNLERDVRAVTAAKADCIHCDVMDGRFVPNITFGPLVIKSIRDKTDLALNTHLMIEHPEEIMFEFIKAGSDSIIVHAEACVHLHRVIQQIKEAGAKAGVALNPSTPLCMIENVMGDIDELLIMTVNPGFGGQEFIASMLPKISDARRMVQTTKRDIDIAVDGGINPDTCGLVVSAGANLLVAGSFVFTGPDGIEGSIKTLRERCCATIPSWA
jgi:ribulose-phosphate 3-epimerase